MTLNNDDHAASRACLVGGGTASLARAAYLIRDGGVRGGISYSRRAGHRIFDVGDRQGSLADLSRHARSWCSTPPSLWSTSLGEQHRSQRIGWLRAAVLGANDGILSTASLMLGVAFAHRGSSDAGEHKELAKIYEARGLEPGLGKEVARQLMAHDALAAPAGMAHPLQAAFSSAASFAVGAVPEIGRSSSTGGLPAPWYERIHLCPLAFNWAAASCQSISGEPSGQPLACHSWCANAAVAACGSVMAWWTCCDCRYALFECSSACREVS